MNELSYRALVWLTYRLAATFALGLPLVLLLWSAVQRENSLVRLLSLYWKVASLMAISMLLLTSKQPLGYVTALIAPLLMVVTVWFWVDLNEELEDLPAWRPLPLTVRAWRWALTGSGLLSVVMTGTALSCIQFVDGAFCALWVEAPRGLHRLVETVFEFLFGSAANFINTSIIYVRTHHGVYVILLIYNIPNLPTLRKIKCLHIHAHKNC